MLLLLQITTSLVPIIAASADEWRRYTLPQES
jgi:hypothetical protein